MKIIIRTFFKILRIILGPFMLLSEFLRRPKGVIRPPAAQAEIDRQTASLALYQYQTCPFCIKVRQEMRRLSLNGKAKVPCLKITDQAGQTQWLYESGEIINYLQGRFGQQAA